jgi:hypothetical protein
MGIGRIHRWILTFSITIGTVLALCSAAGATCLDGVYDQPLPVSSTTPADGASVTASPSAVQWFLASPVHGATLSVVVATQNVLGNDGVLSSLNMVDDFALAESNTYGDYVGVSNAGASLWVNTPGRYYWQAFGQQSYFDPNLGYIVCNAYASPVYTVNVAPPGPPPITTQDAKAFARQMVHMKTGRFPRIRSTCAQIDSNTVHCNLAWTSAGTSFTARGRFWDYIASDGNAYWWFDFRGTRTSLACSKVHPGSRRCRRSFHWD